MKPHVLNSKAESGSAKSKRARWRIATATAVLTTLLATTTGPVNGEALNPQEVFINPGGGVETDGSDGLVIAFNRIETEDPDDPGDFYVVELFDGGNGVDAGSDDVGYASTTQYCCGGSGPKLNIGGILYGPTDPVDFDGDDADLRLANIDLQDISLSIESMSGTASNTRTSDTGSGSAVLRYSISHNGLIYEMLRTITYIYPNNFFLDEYEIIIPAGNDEEVKFYLGGDTAPGNSDSGTGVETTEPVRTIYSINPESEIQFGLGEVVGSAPFDGAIIGHYSAPYETVEAGGELGFSIDTVEHDAGIMIQWNLGTTPGSHDRAVRHLVGARGASVTASFADSEIEQGGTTDLIFEILNTGADDLDVEFNITLPAGLTVAGSVGSTCDAPVNADGGEIAVLGEVPSGSNCFVTVPITSDTPGEYTIDASSVKDLINLENTVAASTLTVTGQPEPKPRPEPECDRALKGGHATMTGDSGYLSRLYMSTFLRQPDAAGHEYWLSQLDDGDSIGHITAFFIESPEFTSKYAPNLTTEDFVELLYNNIMCRGSDPAGLSFWTTGLDAGDWTRASMLRFWTDSTEFKTRSQERLYPT